MCSWERFCTFAREPERRKVGSDARITTDGTSYVVDPEMAGETVLLWWGVFDNELYVENGDKRFGPICQMAGPSRCIDTEPSRRPRWRNKPIVSRSLPRNSACLGPP